MARRSSTEKGHKSTERAKGWLYSVINPLIDGLAGEAELVAGGHLTWRFYSQELERIGPLRFYLAHDAHHALRDYQAVQPEAGRLFEHDERLEETRLAAIAAHAALLGDPEFLAAVETARHEHELAAPGDKPTGAFPPERLADLVAERVINATRTVPPGYTDRDFFNAHGPKLAEHAVKLEELARLTRAKEILLSVDRQLIDWLQNESLRICGEYGISAVPLTALAR
jgi:hypothetical protein